MIALLAACSEFAIHEEPEPPPAEPPERDPDAAFGEPPDWATCETGWFGQYFNLAEEELPAEVPDAADEATLWEERSFSRRDASLDLGQNWWPVDEGLAGDPDFYAARWTAWLRVTGGGSMQIVLGAQTVAWVLVDGVELARVEGEAPFSAELLEVPVEAGQFPIEVRFAQLVAGESGLRFRVSRLEGDVCPPDFSE